VRQAVNWLCQAQDESKSRDGGVARHFSVIDGWSTSYPETTGYIVPTMLELARRWKNDDLRDRARRMLDWLCAIQLPCGGFQGGTIDATPVAHVTFNTGQILLGLAAGVSTLGDTYRDPMRRAADWLVETIDADGCWRQFPSPFVREGEKSYDTHVAWGLLEAARLDPLRNYAEAALANVRWALKRQQPNGWLASCCLDEPQQPLTHTLGYALRGFLEAYRFELDPTLLVAARSTADGLLTALRPNGHLPGRLQQDWNAAVRWACLTGTVQVAHCWFLLHKYTGESRYLDAGRCANAFVRRTICLTGPDGVRGGVQGSYPIYGGYGRYQYLNWAAKFCIDAQLLEIESQ
jgi:hypothetical protein